jgi:hypothetical protein
MDVMVRGHAILCPVFGCRLPSSIIHLVERKSDRRHAKGGFLMTQRGLEQDSSPILCSLTARSMTFNNRMSCHMLLVLQNHVIGSANGELSDDVVTDSSWAIKCGAEVSRSSVDILL